LVRFKLGYASVVWNSVTITDCNKLEGIQRKFAALYHNRVFKLYNITIIIDFKKILTPHIRLHHSDVFSLINAFCGANRCPSSLPETFGIRVPTRNARNFTEFRCSTNHCPSAGCGSAANSFSNLEISSETHV
jgi:hypothetical protein